MRTVDPELWYRKVQRSPIQVTRRLKFGERRGGALEGRLRASCTDALTDWWNNCSHVAVKYINIDTDYVYAKRRHIVVLCLSVLCGSVVVAHTSSCLQRRPPLEVSLQFADNAIARSHFPAIALCSNNVVSKAALTHLTDYMYQHPRNKFYGYSRMDIEHNLVNLGALLTLALPPIKVDFEVFYREVEPNFNITDIMFRLSTNCSVILKRCSWRGRLRDCDSLFATRLTGLGFCCVFNSRYQPEDYGREPAVLDLVGQDYGLGVIIKEERDDFAYVRRPAYGMEVMLLFSGDEFPLVESGAVRMYPLPRNASLFVNVRATSQYPDQDISYYSRAWRKCVMRGASLTRCLYSCRRRTALALCGCVPYVLHTAHTQAAHSDARICTLADLACLNKHREKFMYLNPGGSEPALSQELQDGLYCPQCMVACTRHLYSADISYSYYYHKSKNIFMSALSAGVPVINGTVVRVFYNADHQIWYKLEAHIRWYEAIVKISTQWMALTGVSILCYSEFVYHFTIRWRHHFNRRTRIANMQPPAPST